MINKLQDGQCIGPVKQCRAEKELTLNARLSGPAGFTEWNAAGQGG